MSYLVRILVNCQLSKPLAIYSRNSVSLCSQSTRHLSRFSNQNQFNLCYPLLQKCQCSSSLFSFHSHIPSRYFASSSSDKPPNLAKSEDKSLKKTSEDKTLIQRAAKLPKVIWKEILHYYHGSKLLLYETSLTAGYLLKVARGHDLSRREKRQMKRVIQDLMKTVPFLVLVLIPFCELLIPVIVKVFPGFLPSQYEAADLKKERLKKQNKVKLDMAIFLQEALKDATAPSQESMREQLTSYIEFVDKLKTGKESVSNDEIIKFSSLFSNEITLDKLPESSLLALCKLLNLTRPYQIRNTNAMRFNLRLKLRELSADDKVIVQEGGVDHMTVDELQEACNQRGMISVGVTVDALRKQLQEWLDLNLKSNVPISLLLISRTLYATEEQPLKVEDQIAKVLSTLPDSATEEVTLSVLEKSGGEVDIAKKLNVLKAEQSDITTEEALQAADEAQAAAPVIPLPPPAQPVPEKLVEQIVKSDTFGSTVKVNLSPQDTTESKEEEEDDAAVSAEDTTSDKEKATISTEDLDALESILENILELRNIDLSKEEMETMRQNVADLSAGTSPSLKLRYLSSRLAKLSRKVSNDRADALASHIVAAQESLPEQELADDLEETATRQEQSNNVIHVHELLAGFVAMKKDSDFMARWEEIANAMDDDGDGLLQIDVLVKLIEWLERESIAVDSDNLKKIVKLIKKEQTINGGNGASKT